MKCTVFNIPIDDLARLYEDEKLSFNEIGKIYNIDPYLVRYHAIKNGIKIRTCQRHQYKITDDELIDLYVNQGKTGAEIESIIGIGRNSIIYKLRKLGVSIRSTGNIPDKEYNFKAHNKKEFDDVKLTAMYLGGSTNKEMKKEFGCDIRPILRRAKELGLEKSEEVKRKLLSQSKPDTSHDAEIIKLYNEGKSSVEISKITGQSSVTVLHRLKDNGIKSRTLSESQFTYNKKEIPTELLNPEQLYELYVINKMSKKELGFKFNVAPSVINTYLKKYNIHIRNNSEAKKGLYIGKNHPNWKGGRTGIYLRIREYFYDNQVPDILKRDNYTCQCCRSKKKLQVHHIIPFKILFDEILNEHPDLDIIKNEPELFDIMTRDQRLNDYNNLITYCKECHLFKIHGYKKIQSKDNE